MSFRPIVQFVDIPGYGYVPVQTGLARDEPPLGPDPSSLVFTAENKDVVGLVPGQPVAAHPSGTGVQRAVATSPMPFVGLVLTTTAVGFAAEVRSVGFLTLADWSAVAGTPTLAAGTSYFLSATPGLMTVTPR